MAKKKVSKSIRQKQAQQQNINIRIGDLAVKKKKARRRKPRVVQDMTPMVNLPPVVYQIPEMVTSYGLPRDQAPRSIVEPIPKKTTIADKMPTLEDVGLVGTSEIIDVPTKKEQLAEFITPIEKELKAPAESPRLSLRGFQFPNPMQAEAYLTEAEAVPVKARKPRRPNRTAEEKLQMAMEKQERDKLRAERRREKDEAKRLARTKKAVEEGMDEL
jgi:hypothetical protein